MAFAISVPPLAEAGEEHFIQTLLPDPPESTKGLKQLALIQGLLITLGEFHLLQGSGSGQLLLEQNLLKIFSHLSPQKMCKIFCWTHLTFNAFYTNPRQGSHHSVLIRSRLT